MSTKASNTNTRRSNANTGASNTNTKAAWVSNTLLSDTKQFASQYDSLEMDPLSATGATAPLSVPPEFDGREVWRLYLPPVKNQCTCGGCWAFATSACLAARINIWTTNRVRVDLSPAKMIYCNWGSDQEYALVKRAFDKGLDFTDLSDDIADSVARVGCSGETLIGAWQFLYRYGATTEACHPYSSAQFDLCAYGAGQALPSCIDISGPEMGECQDGSPEKRYRAGGFYLVAGPLHMGEGDASTTNDEENTGNKENDASGGDDRVVPGDGRNKGNDASGGDGGNSGSSGADVVKEYSAAHIRRHRAANVAAIQREIWKYGPVTTGMRVYADLFNWDGTGVYQWDGTSPLTGGHAVVITGWGTADVRGKGAVPYWQVRNSWGAEWGDGGYFRILRGVNHCDLEANVMAGYPDMPLSDRFLLQPRLRTPEDLFLRHVWQYDASGYDLMDIHRILLDQEPERDVTPIYTASMIPDFRTMVAGQPGRITYPYAATRLRFAMFAFVMALGLLLLGIGAWRIWRGHSP